jgi:hypothetical protein
MDRLAEDIQTWVVGEFSGDMDALLAAAEIGDAKAQYVLGFMMTFEAIPGGAGGGGIWMAKAADQG